MKTIEELVKLKQIGVVQYREGDFEVKFHVEQNKTVLPFFDSKEAPATDQQLTLDEELFNQGI